MEKTNFPRVKRHTSSFSHILRTAAQKHQDFIKVVNNEIVFNEERSISNEKLQQLWNEISKEIKRHNWKNNEKITISLLNGGQLDDSGLKVIRLNSRNNFNTIKNVKFDIRKSNQMSDAGVKLLVSNIARNTNSIEKLSLVFSQYGS